jgi:hypothetical protein
MQEAGVKAAHALPGRNDEVVSVKPRLTGENVRDTTLR